LAPPFLMQNGGFAMLIDDDVEFDRPDEPDTLPQDIVDWQPERGHLVDIEAPKVAAPLIGAALLGAAALGAIAVGAVAIGALAIGRARIGKLEIDDLIVRRLRVLED
jgi:hypothetical protein